MDILEGAGDRGRAWGGGMILLVIQFLIESFAAVVFPTLPRIQDFGGLKHFCY